MTSVNDGQHGIEIVVADAPRTVLYLTRLRDGRIALGTKTERASGWEAGEMHILEPGAYLDIAAWLAPQVSAAWIDAIRDRSQEPLRTARELYGGGSQGAARLAEEMLDQIPPELLARAMILLANSIGPEARNRLVLRLNQTTNPSDDLILRRKMSDENEAFAYAIAAAALYDAIASGIEEEGEEGELRDEL